MPGRGSCSMTSHREEDQIRCLRRTGSEMFGDDEVLDLISRILDDRVAATISVKAATAAVAEDVVDHEKRKGNYRHRRKHKSFDTHALLQEGGVWAWRQSDGGWLDRSAAFPDGVGTWSDGKVQVFAEGNIVPLRCKGGHGDRRWGRYANLRFPAG
ncbi:hypothetical protein quinque_014042 [Culex quinquefasciatus]